MADAPAAGVPALEAVAGGVVTAAVVAEGRALGTGVAKPLSASPEQAAVRRTRTLAIRDRHR
jgi:hypothetical protein